MNDSKLSQRRACQEKKMASRSCSQFDEQGRSHHHDRIDQAMFFALKPLDLPEAMPKSSVIGRSTTVICKGEPVMFVVIYTPGPAWQTGKVAKEQPFFGEHVKYMQQVFAAKQLLMGGPFLDIESGLGILDVATEEQARDIVAHDPAVLERLFEPHLHLWHVHFNQYQTRALHQEADAKEPIGREAGKGSEKKRSPTDAEKA
jgi:uncharacterized protein YciI